MASHYILSAIHVCLRQQLRPCVSLLVFALLLSQGSQLAVLAQGTSFTYQGALNVSNSPANGAYDLEFKVYDALSGGTQQGVTLTRAGVTVSGGIFTVELDFGNIFSGAARFLEISVKQPSETLYTTLTPRQKITTTPYAVRSLSAANADTAATATTATNFSGALSGDVTGTQSATTVSRLQGRNVASSVPTSGQVLKFNSSSNQWEPGTDNTGSVTAPLALSASNAAPIIAGTNTGAGAGLAGSGTANAGVYGTSTASSGVKGEISGTSTRADSAGVYGFSGFDNGNGLIGEATNGAAAYGVWGISNAGRGVVGENLNTVRLGSSPGVYGGGLAEDGVWAISGLGNGLYASGGDYAAYLAGKVYIGGPLEKPAGSFKIDHPLDPENKYLYHSFVESPDMKNIYDGVAVLDETGSAEVSLPEWFSALNDNFRYQLTALGAPGPNLYIAQKISNNRFKIAGGTAGMEVSWQLTGIRRDAYANKNRIQVEVEKAPSARGTYLHPEAFDQPAEKGFDWKQRAEELQRLKNVRAGSAQPSKRPAGPTPRP